MSCRLTVDFPANTESTRWTDLFTSDDPEYYQEFDDLKQEIKLFRCRGYVHEWCGNVAIGPFGVKIMHVAK